MKRLKINQPGFTRAFVRGKCNGFSLIEIIIAVLILGLIVLSIYELFIISLKINESNKARVGALALANLEIELIRNLSYIDIGTAGGIPSGDLDPIKTTIYNNINYTVKTDIRYIDDPYDGLIPVDLLNTDYKKVKIAVEWLEKNNIRTVDLTTIVVPEGMETTYGGGTLWIKVFDTAPNPVTGANVHIFNDNVIPNIDANYQTNENGEFILPGSPVSQEDFEIAITKNGYNSSQTYSTTPENPNPDPAHLSVQEGDVTIKLFNIDTLSNLNIQTEDDSALGQNWWNYNYNFRRQIDIANNSIYEIPIHYPVSISLDHLSLVNNSKSLNNGYDIRIIYYNGSSWQEISRINSNDWNLSDTNIWFSTQTTIPATGTDSNYYIYYGYSEATEPNISWNNIFLPEKNTSTVGLWHFEDNADLILTDTSNNDLHGNLYKEAWTANGYFSRAANFDGTEDCINIDHDALLEITDDLTIEVWVYPNLLENEKTIISKKDITNNLKNWQLEIIEQDSNYYIKAILLNNDGEFSVISTTNLEIENWYHMAMSYDSNTKTLSLYINNILQNQTISDFNPILFTSDPIYLGCESADSNYFNGYIDHVRISNSALTNFGYANLAFPQTALLDEQEINAGIAIGNIDLEIRGEKTIGTDGEGFPIYKYNQIVETDASGLLSIPDIEYDTYHISLTEDMKNLYDIAQSNPFLPTILPPGTTTDITISLSTHQTNTMLVTVKKPNMQALPNSAVRLQSTTPAYDVTINSGPSGQTFFTPLDAGTYTLTVNHPLYLEYTIEIDVAGQTAQEVLMSEI